MRSKEQAPLRLARYKNSPLDRKMGYVHTLLRWALSWLNDVQEMSPEAAFDALAAAKRIRRTASALEKSLEEVALAEMFHAEATYYRGRDYTAVLRPGTDRKEWKHAEVMEALIDSTCVRFKERFPYVPDELLRTLVTESMWEVHKRGRVQWRSTDLRKAGVDPDDFSARTTENPSIDLRGAGSYYTPAAKRRPRGV